MADAKGHSDKLAAAGKAPSAQAGRVDLTDAEIAAYLRDHPDFLNDHAELLPVLTPPGYRRGDHVIDMQQFMLQRLRDELTRVKDQQKALIATSRANLTTQQRIHAGVLALIAATSFEQLIQTVMTDLAVLLDLDVITLCVESGREILRSPLPGLQILEPGQVEALLGPGRDARLSEDIQGDPVVFGGGAGLVRSEALLRLDVADGPSGLIAFGARQADKFKPGQGTELLCFLARSLGVTISQWLGH